MPIAPDGTPLPYPEDEMAGGMPPELAGLLGGGMEDPLMEEEPLPEEEEEAPGDPLDILREMLRMAGSYQDAEQDEEDLLIIEKVRTQLQQLLAKQQKDSDAAFGVTPQQRVLRRG